MCGQSGYANVCVDEICRCVGGQICECLGRRDMAMHGWTRCADVWADAICICLGGQEMLMFGRTRNAYGRNLCPNIFLKISYKLSHGPKLQNGTWKYGKDLSYTYFPMLTCLQMPSCLVTPVCFFQPQGISKVFPKLDHSNQSLEAPFTFW